MLKPRYSNQFKKDYKLAIKRGKDESLFIEVLEKLIKQEPLPVKNKDHQLSGNVELFQLQSFSLKLLIFYLHFTDSIFS